MQPHGFTKASALLWSSIKIGLTWKRTGLPKFKDQPQPENGVAFLETIQDAGMDLVIPRRNSLGTPNTLNIDNSNAAVEALKQDPKYGTGTDRTEGRVWWDVE